MDKLFLNEIKEAKSICIFAHHYPDGDCLGSEMGLKKVLLANFPDKEVYAIGENSARWGKVFDNVDEVDDETVRESLAIIVDHNSYNRCGDKRIHTVSKGLRFDHHIGGKEPFPFPAFVDEDAVSASQVIVDFLIRVGLVIPKEAMDDFLIAFYDDKRQYTAHNMPACADEIEELFLSLGADKEKALEYVYAKDETQLAYEMRIKNAMQRDGDVVYAVMSQEDYESLNYSYPDAGSKSDFLLSISDAQVALLFTYAPHEIRLSARSRAGFSVQALCAHFGGGGHLQAAGAVFRPDASITEIIRVAKEMLGE